MKPPKPQQPAPAPSKAQVQEAVWQKHVACLAMGLDSRMFAEAPPFELTPIAHAAKIASLA